MFEDVNKEGNMEENKKVNSKNSKDVLLSDKENELVDSLIDETTKPSQVDETNPSSENQSDLEGEVDKTQQALDEVSQSPAAKENQLDPNILDNTSDVIYVSLPKYEGENIEQDVEAKRKQFRKLVVKSNRYSKYGMIAVFVLIIVSFVLGFTLPENIKWLTYIFIALAIVLLVLMFILTRREQKGISLEVTNYVSDVISLVDSFVFDNPRFEDVTYSVKDKLQLDDIVQAHYFDTINKFNSRNVVKAKLNGKEFKVGEIACVNPFQATSTQEANAKKKPDISYGIFGKYICYPLTLIEDTGLIVRLSGRNAYMPTFLDGYLELQVENLKEDYKVWTTNNVVATNLLSNPELIEVLNSISPNDFLENVFLCINSNGLKIALNFNESVMEVPTEAPINGTPYQEYKAELDKVIQIIDIIEKSNCSNK